MIAGVARLAVVVKLLEFICRSTENRLYQFVSCAILAKCFEAENKLSRDLAVQLKLGISTHDEWFSLSADGNSFISQDNPEVIYSKINQTSGNPIVFQVFVSEQGTCLCSNNNGLQYFDGSSVNHP